VLLGAGDLLLVPSVRLGQALVDGSHGDDVVYGISMFLRRPKNLKCPGAPGALDRDPGCSTVT
jgi:hypothetical protein